MVAAVVATLVVVAGGLTLALTRKNSATSGSPATVSPPSSATTPTSPSTVSPGYLRTNGTRIVDSSGATVQLSGYDVTGMESTNPQGTDVPGECNDGWKPLTQEEVSQIAGYGFNTVRLPIAWGNLEPTPPTVGAHGSLTHQWNTAYVSALDREIAELGAAHLWVVLDMHQSNWSPVYTTPATSKRPGCPGAGMPTWLNPDGVATTSQSAACDFYSGTTEPGVPGTAWSDFAAAESYIDGHYAGDPTVVGQDVVNEPYCARSTANLTGFYQAVVPQIHSANPNILLMLEDRETPGSFQLTRAPQVPNVVLSVHLHEDYWTAPTAGQSALPVSAQAALAADVARSRAWNIPLYVGEFYAFDATGNQNGNKQPDQNWQADTSKFLSFAKANDVGWTYWAWIQKSDPTTQPEITSAIQAALQGA